MADNSEYKERAVDQRFQLLVNSVFDYAIYMLDPEGRIATWNPGARRFKGYEADEVIGEHFSRLFTEEDREAGLPQQILATAASEGRFEEEGWRVRKDGTRFVAHVVVAPIRDETGQLLGFAKITRDITDKKRAEQALFESEQRFRMLVQGVRDYAIYMLDTEGRVTNWNSGAESIKGYTADEIIGKHFSRFYTEEDRANGEPERALATARREGKYEREAWRLRKDGTRFLAHVVLDPIYAQTGELAGYAKITRDITERRREQEELEEAKAALFQSQKLQALGELTGGIAHDFNNLMTIIRGSSELLQREGMNEEKRRRYLQAIIDTADRAATLTSHLLAFGRRQPLRPEVMELNPRMDALAEMLSRTLGSHIEVKLELAPSLWRVEADAAQLETALLNAAINARDAMPEGGLLTIASANEDCDGARMVSVALSDTGAGMPQEVLARAFEPFFTTKPVGKGTGLGLSQIHGFAAQSGGRAEIESIAGKGTTIRILLPATDKPISVEEEQPGEAVVPMGLKVLLVEDNDQIRLFAELLLKELGCTVVTAETADQALQILDREKVDFLFSDVVMPQMSGVEMAHLVLQKWPDLPILLASGYSEEIVEGAAEEFHTLRKPYGAESLRLAMAEALSRKRDGPEAGEAAV
jgi:PAS domain S-box-containing protein